MGFEFKPRVFRLEFTDPALDGLTVRAQSLTLAEFMDMTGLDDRAVIGGVTLPAGMPVRPSLAEAVAGRIIEWNLERHGEPVKPSAEALRGQDMHFVRAVVKAYLEAVSGVSAGLGKESGSGGTSPEALMAELDDLSKSLPSS
jgi:hypothetical protein